MEAFCTGKLLYDEESYNLFFPYVNVAVDSLQVSGTDNCGNTVTWAIIDGSEDKWINPSGICIGRTNPTVQTNLYYSVHLICHTIGQAEG